MRQPMRRRLVDAATKVVRTQGLAAATSKGIAREAGVAVGSIYNHFVDKTDLVTAVMVEALPTLDTAVRLLQSRIGRDTVRTNLEELARSAIAFFDEYLALIGGLYSDVELRGAVRHQLVSEHRDLSVVLDGVAAYVAGEQRISRIGPAADPRVVAALVLGACSQYVLLAQLGHPGALPDVVDYAALAVSTLLAALEPGTPT